MDNMQLIIKTPLDTFPKLIEFNFSELQEALRNSLQAYQDIAYTPETMRTAKTDRATLNKLKSAIEAERRSMKAICLKPFEDFDAKTKQLISMIDEPVKQIDAQVKRYEAEQRGSRKQALREYYEAEAGELANDIPFDRIFEQKWSNATYDPLTAKEFIQSYIRTFKADLQTIETMGGEFEIPCRAEYFKTLKLSSAINEKAKLEGMRLAKLTEEAAAQDPAPNPEPTKQEEPAEQPRPEPAVSQNEPAPVRTWTMSLRVVDATAEQLRALKQFLISNNIKFERA